MKLMTVQTKNIKQLIGAIEDLMHRPMGVEGMGLLHALPGSGKTTAAAYARNLFDAVFVRAISCWTVTSMLGAICEELGGKRLLRRTDMIGYIVQALAENPRPIFVDEADYLFNQFEMVESLRDIYDLSGCSVILIGMEDIARRIQSEGRFARRITQWIEFGPLDIEDTEKVANELCDVALTTALVSDLHKSTSGNIGRIVVGLSRIEKLARTSGLQEISLEDWGDRDYYFDQPVFGKRG